MTTIHTTSSASTLRSIRRSVAPLFAFVAVAATVPAWATPVTYTFTALGVNGNVGNSGTTGSLSDAVTGGDSFSGATLTMSLTGDTTDVTGSNGDLSRLGSIFSVAGDRISYTLSGGGLSSPVSGTMLAADGWTFQSGTGSFGQGSFTFFSRSAGAVVSASFMRPGPISSPVPTYDYMVNSGSFSVTSRTIPGSESLEDPPGSYVGGTNFRGWEDAVGIYRMMGTSVGGLYFTNAQADWFNGSFDVAVVPEPSTVALGGVAALVCGGAALRSRRKQKRA
jgi:hypothetical protein